MDEEITVDIESIKKFLSDKDAWYHIKIPESCSDADLLVMKHIIDNWQLEGKFLVTRTDTKITDITEYVNRYMDARRDIEL
jgi:hypothetical protein